MPLNWDKIVELKKTQPEAANKLVATAFQGVCSSLYITCFSKNYLRPASQIMWAHYGVNHTGVCICVDFSDLKTKGSSEGLYPVQVQYSDSLFEERQRRSPNSPDLGILIGATKSKVWDYEEEVRLVVEADSFDSTKFNRSADSKTIDVVFNPECISRVIFGLKSSTEDIKIVVESFCDVGHTPLFTRLDLDPLTLDVVEKDLTITEEIMKNRNKYAESGPRE
jgi:hypothetical protein